MTHRPWLKIDYDPHAAGYCWGTNWPRRGKHRMPGQWIVFDKASKKNPYDPDEVGRALFMADTSEECNSWIAAQTAQGLA